MGLVTVSQRGRRRPVREVKACMHMHPTLLLYAYVQLYVYLALARYVRGTAVRIRHRVDVSSDASGNMHATAWHVVNEACTCIQTHRLAD